MLGLPTQTGASADRIIGLRSRQRRGHGAVVGVVEFAAAGFGVRPPHCLKKKGTRQRRTGRADPVPTLREWAGLSARSHRLRSASGCRRGQGSGAGPAAARR